jgi:hypothetical protein
MIIRNEGSIVLFQPEGDFEYEWLMTSVESEPWQWMGRSLAVDYRMADNLIEGCQGAGWVIDLEGNSK